jgi:tetratricopeptide (TPR) repeat protein
MAHNQMFEWDYLYNKAHNEFLNYLATTGLFGLGTYLLIFATFGFCSLKVIMSKRSPHSDLLAAALAGTAALAVSNFFGFSTVACQVLQFLLLALSALIISNQSITNDKPIKKSPASSTPFSWISLVIIAAAIFALTAVWRYWYGDFLYARGKNYISSGQSLRGLEYIMSATKVSPSEALYYNDLADFFAQLAATYYASDDDATKNAGLAAKDQTLAYLAITQKLNPVHLNFFKTRTRVYTALAVFDENYLTLAKENLEQAMSLAPTDPKLVYQYSQLLAKLGEPEVSEKYLRQALSMRPSYHEVRQDLGKLEESRGHAAAALEHYRYIIEHITPNDKQAQAALLRLASGSAQIAPPTNATESTAFYE